MINLNDYRRVAKPVIKQWFDTRPEDKYHEQISQLSLYIPCPCIATCYFLMELYGETPEILKNLASLVTFYKVEVSGKLNEEG